jgi:hypothetical protein
MIGGDELRHVEAGPLDGERSTGIGVVSIAITAASGAEQVIERAREVMRVVLTMPDDALLSGDPTGLPAWFVDSFAPEVEGLTTDQWWGTPGWSQWWEQLPERLREQVVRYSLWKDSFGPWRVSIWLWQTHRDQREWDWWDAVVIDRFRGVVSVEVAGWPYPWDNLRWLLAVAGADVIESEDEA